MPTSGPGSRPRPLESQCKRRHAAGRAEMGAGMNNKPNVREIVMDRLSKATARAAQLVVVSRHEDFGFTPSQFGPGWEIRRVHQPRELERVVRTSSPMAGVIDLQTA